MRAIPVLAYHSIAPGEKINPELFASHLRVLAECKLPSLSPQELVSAQKGFLLTFDDGFADLWTQGFALLKERRIKATVFVIPARTGDEEPRVQGTKAFSGSADDAHAQACARQWPHPAFLRWSELAEMEASGLVTVQSHSLTHAMGWTSDEIVGFNLGKPGKTHWSLPQANSGDIRLGVPLYKRGSALANRLYFGNPALNDALSDWLEKKGGEAYVKETGVEQTSKELAEIAAKCRNVNSNPSANRGRWETDEEMNSRIFREIAEAREILEAKLGGKRDELCLPWGEGDATTIQCAKKAGINRIYALNRQPNTAGKIGLLVNRFEPRPKSAAWLRTRLAIYGSTFFANVYGAIQGR